MPNLTPSEWMIFGASVVAIIIIAMYYFSSHSPIINDIDYPPTDNDHMICGKITGPKNVD